MELVNDVRHKKTQKEQMKYYKKKLVLVQQYCKSNSFLNSKQKERFNFFIDRSIRFCNTMKPVEYDRTIYKKDVQAVISNTYQHLIYNSLYKMLIGISNEVTVDTILSTENKNILNKYIAYSISHIQGKMNCKFN